MTAAVVAALAVLTWRIAPQLESDPQGRFQRSELAAVLGPQWTASTGAPVLPASLRREVGPKVYGDLDSVFHAEGLDQLVTSTAAFNRSAHEANIPAAITSSETADSRATASTGASGYR